MKKKKISAFGGILAVAMMAFMLVGIFYTPYDPEAMDPFLKFAPASLAHPFGCDQFGRDIFSRVLEGGRTSLLIAFCTVCIGAACGAVVGSLTGYFGGVVDEVLMRFNDSVAAFPSILLALVCVSIFGTGKYKII